MTSDDVQRLVDHKTKSKSQARIQPLAILLLDTGLRLAEALALRATDIDLDNFLIRVEGKGRKERVVFFYDLANLPMCGQQLAANDNWSRLTNAAVAKWMHFTTIEPMYEFQSVLP